MPNTKLHAVTNAKGRPLTFVMTAGQVSDFTGAAALLGGLPKSEWLLADRGYDADWFSQFSQVSIDPPLRNAALQAGQSVVR